MFESRCFISLMKKHVEKKIEALRCYESQKHRDYLTEDAIWSIARLRGTQLEGGYAEAFEVMRLIIDS